MSGRPSALCGRAHARVPRIGASATPGTNVLARRRIGSTQAAGSGSRARNVDPTEAMPASGTRLKSARSGSASCACVPMAAPISASSRTWVGPAGSSSSTTTPQRSRIGRHAPGRVDEGGRPWPGRDEDRVGRDGPAVDDDPGDGVAADVERRRAALPDGHPAPFGERRIGVRGGARLDRVADPDPAGPQPRRQRRLEPLEARAADHVAWKLGERLGQRPVHAADRGLVVRGVQQPDRLIAQAEPEIERGQVPVEVDGLAIERREDRVERMLDDAGIRARGARGESLALDDRDPRAAIGEERRRSRADDPAADDDDIRTPLAHARHARDHRPDDGPPEVARPTGLAGARAPARSHSVEVEDLLETLVEPGRRVGQRVDQLGHLGLPAVVDGAAPPWSPGTPRSRRPRGRRTGRRRG